MRGDCERSSSRTMRTGELVRVSTPTSCASVAGEAAHVAVEAPQRRAQRLADEAAAAALAHVAGGHAGR